MRVTGALREELAHVPLPSGGPAARAAADAELSAALRFGGVLTLSGRGVGLTFTTTTGAVVRRVRAALDAGHGVRPEIEVVRPGGLSAELRYRLLVRAGAGRVLTTLGLLDADGRPVEGLSPEHVGDGPDRSGRGVAYARGALMAAGSVSAPGAPAHLEVRAPGRASAEGLAALLVRIGADGARAGRAGRDGGEWRVVAKSGRAVGALLARLGAHQTFLHADAGRLQRELRSAANRVANADRANLARGVDAASRQVAAVERALADPAFDDLPDDVRQVALVRIANPEASLAELGTLVDPPVGKATVHRRLARLAALAEGRAADG